MGTEEPRQDSKLGTRIVADLFLGVVALGFFINQVASEVRVPLVFNIFGAAACLALILCVNVNSVKLTLWTSALLLLSLVGLLLFEFLGHVPAHPSTHMPTKTPSNADATAHVTDNWSSGTIDSTVWGNWGGAQVTIDDGHLKIDSTLNGNYYGIGTKIEPLDLRGSYVFDEVLDAGNQQIQSWGCYPVTIATAPDYNDQVVWQVSDDEIAAYEQSPASITTIRVGAYTPATEKFFRIRESNGTLYWEYSADGSNWVPFTSAPDPFDVSDVIIGANAGTSSDETSTTSCLLDNFNTP